jgi:Na+-transporting NADH:ubiquinone oxidoreductase subunit NqrD
MTNYYTAPTYFDTIVSSSRDLVVSTLQSYISMSMQLVIQFKISQMFFVVESQCLKSLKYYNCPS